MAKISKLSDRNQKKTGRNKRNVAEISNLRGKKQKKAWQKLKKSVAEIKKKNVAKIKKLRGKNKKKRGRN